jgi:AraC family transcriptional regulator, melibiose operon regulatory protein
MVESSSKTGVVNTGERRFHARSKAFGRFGMRIFSPLIMVEPHWHGHIETNYIRHARLHYRVDGTAIVLDPDQLVIFWANVPHQLTKIETLLENALPELSNIYLPLDTFLVMPHLAELQIALLNGAMVVCPKDLCNFDQLRRWYEDYRSGSLERLDIVKMELNAMFRRIATAGPIYLRQPWLDRTVPHNLSSSHIKQVVAMVKHVLDNLESPMRNSDVAAVTGLHTNYALSIFSKVMSIPMKQFILRMRLLRARGLLLESDLAIVKVVDDCGFGSTSQFYSHFSAAYGISPGRLREKYLKG